MHAAHAIDQRIALRQPEVLEPVGASSGMQWSSSGYIRDTLALDVKRKLEWPAPVLIERTEREHVAHEQQPFRGAIIA
jgi:hypothetical protein